jgi:hypothetical protein
MSKFEGGYDDGYPEGDEAGHVDIKLQRQMTLADFMRTVTKVAEHPLPEAPQELMDCMGRLVEQYNKDKENQYEMNEKRILSFTILMMVVSQRNGKAKEDVIKACGNYSRLMVAPRFLWGHFMLDLATFSFGCDDMGKAWLSKKYNLPESYWTTEQPEKAQEVENAKKMLHESIGILVAEAEKQAKTPEAKDIVAKLKRLVTEDVPQEEAARLIAELQTKIIPGAKKKASKRKPKGEAPQ